MRNLPIGVFAIGSCPIKSNKQDLGVTGKSLEIGGVKVEKGSWIYADETGVLLSKVELEVN